MVNSSTSTTSNLTSSPNPSSYGSSVTFTDTVSASSGTPGGTVTFYSCTTSACSTKTSLGTETLAAGKATFSTSSLPVGTTYVEAIYGASGNYTGSTSNVVTQVVNALGTNSVPHLLAQPLELRLFGRLHRHRLGLFGHPERTGDLLQLHHHACSTKTSLGTGDPRAGKATLSTSSLPVGTTYVEAIYGASGNYTGSTSNVVTQVVNIAVPPVCASSGYGTYLVGNPSLPFINGTNDNDFIYAFGASYWINGFWGTTASTLATATTS